MKLPEYLLSLPNLQQIPLCEWREERGYWIVWISYDNTESIISAGTYIELRSDGSAWKITVDKSGEVVRTMKV